MEHPSDRITPEAATDEPASSLSPAPAAWCLACHGKRPDAAAPDDPLSPGFETEAEENAYWRGVTLGIRSVTPAAPEPPAPGAGGAVPFLNRSQRKARHDGFTPERRAVFLEALADGATVERAAALAGISTNTAYNLRNRREGRAFDLAWEAAIRRGRKVVADRLRDRGIEGQIATRYDKDGNVVGTRHYYDNRLAQAQLTRLDAKVEAYRDDERLITALSEEFEELLDCIEADGDAEAFIEERRPPSVELGTIRIREGLSDAEIAARWRRLHEDDDEDGDEDEDLDPEEIDTSDLDPARRHEWTGEQWDRAEASGFLDDLDDEAGPGEKPDE